MYNPSVFRENLFQAEIVIEYDEKFGAGSFSEDFGPPPTVRMHVAHTRLWAEYFQDAYDAIWNGTRAI